MTDQWQPISTFPIDSKFYLCEDESGHMMVMNCPGALYHIGVWVRDKKDGEKFMDIAWQGAKIPGFVPKKWRVLPASSMAQQGGQ